MEYSVNINGIPFIHIQDIEDYYDDYQKSKFFDIIDEMRKAEEIFSISYELGYFECLQTGIVLNSCVHSTGSILVSRT